MSSPVARPQKTRKRKSFGSEAEEEEFEVKLEVNSRKVTYKKKNTESNIVNQTFSYLNSHKSRREAMKLLNNSKKVEEFYRLMAKVKKGSSKKYINRKFIKQLLACEEGTCFFGMFSKAKIELLTVEEVRRVLRVLTYYFLKNEVELSLLTSAKIYKEALMEHFWRKREILKFLF